MEDHKLVIIYLLSKFSLKLLMNGGWKILKKFLKFGFCKKGMISNFCEKGMNNFSEKSMIDNFS